MRVTDDPYVSTRSCELQVESVIFEDIGGRMMRILMLISRIGVWLTLFGPVFLSVGETQAAAVVHIEREDLQLERNVNLSFGLKQLQGEVTITVSTKPAPQMVGISEQDTSQGSVPQLRLANDEQWTEKWTSKPIRVKESGTRLPDVFRIKFKFSEPQPMKFDVKYTSGKPVGTCVTFLSEIASAGQKVDFLQVKLTNDEWDISDGVIVIEFEEDLKGFDDEISYEFVGENFDPDTSMYPYIILSRQRDDKSWKQIDTTFTTSFDNRMRKNPEFRPLSVRVSHITQQHNKELQLKFECKVRNYDKPEVKHEYVGEFQTTFWELTEGDTFNCNPVGVKDKHTNVVTLKSRTTVPTFLKIVPGLDIQAFVAIDFTSSNKQGKYEHFDLGMHTVGETLADDFNYYEQALSSVVPVVELYDQDKNIPLSGFCGRINGERTMSEFFYLKPLLKAQQAKNDDDYFCHGSVDLLRTYHQLMLERAIRLASPTFYAPTIEEIAKIACAKRGHNDSYFMLVVLTDGAYTDPEDTKLQIAKASDCPLSIILVGIGVESFELLEELDNDNGLPFQQKDKKTGIVHEAKADIVQLVVFRDFYNTYNLDQAMVKLKDAVLEEFPAHVQSYFKLHNLSPNKSANGIKPLEDVTVPTAHTKHDLFKLINK